MDQAELQKSGIERLQRQLKKGDRIWLLREPYGQNRAHVRVLVVDYGKIDEITGLVARVTGHRLTKRGAISCSYESELVSFLAIQLGYGHDGLEYYTL